jgi:hypothetical protein
LELFSKLRLENECGVNPIKTLVSTPELKRLLVELREKRSDIHIRFRLIGQMWKPNFLKILNINDKGIILLDEIDNTLIFVTDLSRVMQFEIDATFQGFQPHHHYTLQPVE